MKAVYKAIGNALRQKRREFPMTQEQLATLANTSTQHIRRIERGVCGPSLELLYRIAGALECPVYTFLPASDAAQVYSFLTDEINQRLNSSSLEDRRFVSEFIDWYLTRTNRNK